MRYDAERLPTPTISSKRVAINLAHAENTARVFWSSIGNSYVFSLSSTGRWQHNGRRVDLLSINGIGEIRWSVTNERGHTEGDVQAAEYFGLKWYGYLLD